MEDVSNLGLFITTLAGSITIFTAVIIVAAYMVKTRTRLEDHERESVVFRKEIREGINGVHSRIDSHMGEEEHVFEEIRKDVREIDRRLSRMEGSQHDE